MSMQYATETGLANPIDSVEEVLSANNWTYNRMNEDELMVYVSGQVCSYRLFFMWQEEMNALQFCCQYDLKIDARHNAAAARALMLINEKLWMGHFDIPSETGTPSFRHTCLFRGLNDQDASSEPIEDLVDIAMTQCERFHPVFHMLCQSATPDEQSLALALMDTRGRT